MALGDVIARLSVVLGLDTASFETGVTKAEKRLGQTEKKVESLGDRMGAVTTKMSGFTKALGALGLALGLRELGNMADEWSEMNARLVNATGSTDAGAAAMERLTEVARRSYSPISQTTESFIQQSTALNALGVSTQTQLDLTEALNNALVISSTRGQRAQSVMDAWAKAMALGKMSGDQLNTVISGSNRLAQALADSMGINVNELQKYGAQGKITREVMLGITGQLEQLRTEAEEMPATLEDGLQLMKDGLLQLVGNFDQTLGISASLAGAMILLADNLDAVAVAGAAVGASFAAMKLSSAIGAMTAYVGQVVALERALGATNIASALFGAITKNVTVAFRALTVAMIANPFTLIAGAIAGVTALLYTNRDAQVSVGDEVVRLGDIFLGIWEGVKRATQIVQTLFTKGWTAAFAEISPALAGVGRFFDRVFTFIGNMIRDRVNFIAGLFVGLGNAIRAAFGEGSALEAFRAAQGRDYVAGFASAVREGVVQLANFGEAARGARAATDDVTSSTQALGIAAEEAGKKAKNGLAEAEREAQRVARELARILDRLFPEVAARTTYEAERALLIAQGASEEALRRLANEWDLEHNKRPEFDFGAPIEGMNNMEAALERLVQKSKDNTVRIAKTFKDMADETMSALSRLTDSIRGGGFLGILEAVIGLGMQLGSIGAFGKSIAGRLNKVPAYANGTKSHPGGMALVGERGMELVDLPRRSRVHSNRDTMAMARRQVVEIVDTTGLFRFAVNGQIMESAPDIMQGGAAMAGAARARSQKWSLA